MSSISQVPSNPFHIARAYQVMPPRAAQPPVQAAAAGPVATIGKPTSRIAAAVVPGKIDFSGSEPTQTGPALQMYRHPADKNAAATALSAGRMLDIQA